ncbi:MAG: 30S ribosomal protein S13 [Candidatus Micrarchaeaceae archaeon]
MASERKSEENKQQSSLGIVRLAGRDVRGDLRIDRALAEVKGIGHNLAAALVKRLYEREGIDKNAKIGELDEKQLESVEKIIKDPKSYNIMPYLLNRRKDRETKEDMLLVGTDLIVKTKQDIDYEIKIQSWRGFRHQYGQKVRGQRTRSTGRTGIAVGVMKKAAKEAAKKEEEKK